jgi:soluble lytic murein transglycosylase-like protein
VEAVIRVESAWNPYAVSRRGAAGLMQLMPWHTRTMRNPFDPSENVWTGCGLLAECLKIEHGDIRRALMRYNAGQWNGITGYAYATKILKEMEEGS